LENVVMGEEFEMKRCPFRDFIILTSAVGGEDLVNDFYEDPDGVAADYGLSEDQKGALLSGDQTAIQEELGNENCKGKHKWTPFGLMT